MSAITVEQTRDDLLAELEELVSEVRQAAPERLGEIAARASKAVGKAKRRLAVIAKRDDNGSERARLAAPVTRTPADVPPDGGDKTTVTPPSTLHRLRPALLLAGTVLSILVALLILAGCGKDAVDPPVTTAAETVSIDVTLTTTSGTVCANHDDQTGLWPGMSYVLRDDESVIIAIGAETTDGATVGGRAAAVGRVIELAPNYQCELDFTIDAPESDFYQLEITVDGLLDDEHSVEAAFSLDDAGRGPVMIEVQ